MLSTKKLSIIIPTLNCCHTLESTIESLAPLKKGGAEIIIVDSFSNDGTAKIGQAKSNAFLQVPAGNMYAAINAGMRYSQREWLTYINADDILYSQTIIKAFEKAPEGIDLLYGSLDYIDAEGRFLHGFIMPPPKDFLALAAEMINGVPPQGAFYNRKLFETIGGFDEKLRLAGDFDFFIRAYMAGFNFYQHARPALAGYRMHPLQYSQRKSKDLYNEGLISLSNNKVSISSKQRKLANFKFRLRNINSYMLRLLRNLQIIGKLRLNSTLYFNK